MLGGKGMEERDWLIIKTLYEQKNVTKTAEKLYLSQPTLTARIKHIENALGAKLLYRGNKGITFTDTGEYAVKFADKILKEIRTFKENIAAMQNDVAGELRIAAPALIVKYYFPKVLDAFQTLYPKVKFDVRVACSSDVYKLLSAMEIHFGFLRNDTDLPEDEKILLSVNHICAVSTQKFKLLDLPNMVRVDYDTDKYYKNMLNDWWKEIFNEAPIIGTKVNNLDMCKEMVFNGLGYGILPSILLKKEPYLYSIPLKHKDGKIIERKTWLIYKKETMDSLLSKTFRDFLEDADFDSFQRDY